VPIAGTLLAMWIMRGYDLDEQRAMDVHAQLEQRRQQAGSADAVPAASAA
jgi:GPH family glycoside/pentoside/hexuronide:cation symporter